MARKINVYIPDLRYDYDEKGDVADGKATGTFYRKGRILQVWWETNILGLTFHPPEKGRETWHMPNLEQAKQSFKENVFGEMVNYRSCTCLDCKHKWDAVVKLSEHTENLSGEKTNWCPKCGTKNVMGSQVKRGCKNDLR